MKSFVSFMGKLCLSMGAAFLCSLLLFAQPSQAASLRGSNNEEKIFYYLLESMNMNTAGASGVLANVFYESGFNPRAEGDNGTSYGICQWHNLRYEALKRYCSREGYDYKTLEGQLSYLNDELNSDAYLRRSVLNPILAVPNNKKGAYSAGYTWCYYFEIPADRETKAAARGELAKKTYFPKYKNMAISLSVGETYETDEGIFIATGEKTVSFKGMIDKTATSLVIPDKVEIGNVTAKVTEIAPNACKNKKLEYVVIGKYVKKIGKTAFYKCKNLNTVVINSKKITAIGGKAFKKISGDAVFYVNKSVKKKYKKLLKKTASSDVVLMNI